MGKRPTCRTCGQPLQRLSGSWPKFAQDHAAAFGYVVDDAQARGILGARIAHAVMVHDELPSDVDGLIPLPGAVR